MFDLFERLLFAGMPVVGLAGPYTIWGMETHVSVDPCHWFEIGDDWYRVDVRAELDALQLDRVRELLTQEED